MKKLIISAVLSAFLTASVTADMDAVLRPGVDARSVSLGQAQTADIKEPTNGFANPAALAGTHGIKFSSGAADVYGLAHKTMSLIFPALTGQFGLLVVNADENGIAETTLSSDQRPILTGNSFGYYARAYYLSFAKSFGKIFAGANVKYFTEQLSSRSSSGVGVDVGVLAKPAESFSVGLNLGNVVAPQMKWDTASGTTVKPVTKARLGASLQPSNGPCTINGDVAVAQNQNPEFFVGGEYALTPSLQVRGGVADGLASLGVGVNYKDVNFDYSYSQGNEYLEPVHRVNLSLAFNGREIILPPVSQLKDNISREAAALIEKLEEKVTAATITTNAGTMEIAFYSEMIFPGRKFYFKVITLGGQPEKVTVSINEHLLSLYSNDLVTWKGDYAFGKFTPAGRRTITIYVSDAAGHLYTEKVDVAVEALPEINIIKASFQPRSLNTFQAKVPPHIAKASLVMGNQLVPLIIHNGIASAKFYVEHLPQNSRLYLADQSGHVFVCSLVSDIGGIPGGKGDWNWLMLVIALLLSAGIIFFWRRGNTNRW